MAVANFAASVQGVALRICRLDAQGNPMNGAENVYVTRSFMRVSFTPEYEDGDEVTEKNAAGEVCVTFKSPDTLKRATMEIAICEPDPEVTELLTGGVLLKYGADGTPPGAVAGTPPAGWPVGAVFPDATVGYASSRVGESPNPNGVGVEVWSLAVRDGARDANLPYFRWVFPKCTLRPSGDRVIESGLLANAFEGWSVGNMYFGTGPADDWYWPDATDRPFAYARDYMQPWTGTNGWYTYAAVPDPGAPATIAGPTGVSEVNPEYGVIQPTGKTYKEYEAENPTGASGPTVFAGTAPAAGPAGPASRKSE